MERHKKEEIIEGLVKQFEEYNAFYITDTNTLNSAKTSALRHAFHKGGVKMQVAKNTLIEKALEKSGRASEELISSLKGNSAILFTKDAKAPAHILKEFRRTADGKPLLKAAYIDSSVYLGDNQLDELMKIKSKEEMVGEVIGMLMSPAQTVIGALQSGGNKLAGILKTLEERTLVDA